MSQASLLTFDDEAAAALWSEVSGPSLDGGSTVWGDGFIDDGWVEIRAVTSWAQCSPDEYIRLFPRLLADTPGPNPLLIDHLARRATVCADLVARDRLQALLSALNKGAVPDSAPMSSAAFAFHAGLHPAYLWPDALCTAERDTAAGWLGLLYRGRSALMPFEVADYLLDTIVDDGPHLTMRDPAVAALVEPRDLRRLRAWAAGRVAGEDGVGRLRRGSGLRWFAFGSGSRPR